MNPIQSRNVVLFAGDRVMTRYSGQLLGILVQRDRPFWYRDRSFRLNVTGDSG